MNDSENYVEAALAGVVAGMRSMSAPALVSRLNGSGLVSAPHSSLRLLSNPRTATIASVLAAGELIADKLPFLPSRLKPGSLIARAVSGGISGASVVSSRKGSPLLGALVGAAAAVGMSYAAYKARKELGKQLHVPDFVVAIAEDALLAGVCYVAVRRLRSAGGSA